MNNLKRFLALVLAMSMMLTAVPFGVFAADSDIGHMATKPADGTSSNEPFPENTGGSYSFRIPAMVTLSDGTVVAAADARWNTTYDGGGLDTIVARSSDNGVNWNYTFANYLGDNGNVYNGGSTCFIDPSLAVTENDTIYMLCDLYPYGVALNGSKETTPKYDTGFNTAGKLLLSNNSHASYDYYLDGETIYSTDGTAVSGYSVDEYFNVTKDGAYHSNLFFSDCDYKVARTAYLYLTKSTNKGETWSEPTLLPLKTDQEMACLVGPNGGMVTSDGVIVFPVYSYSETGEYTGLVYSKDNGATWERSATLTAIDSSEADAVELGNGKLRVFFRNETTYLRYADYDLETNSWSTVVNTGVHANSNTELSAITYSRAVKDNGVEKDVILVSCPASANLAGSSSSDGSWRTSGRIFAGLVDPETYEMTWLDKSVQVTPVASSQLTTANYTAAQGFFAYSSIAELDEGTVAILYEDNQFGWGAGSNYGYTLAYDTFTESDLETALGVTFIGDTDIDVDGSEGGNDDDTTTTENVTLAVGDTETYTIEGVSLNGSYSDSIASVTWVGSTYATATLGSDANYTGDTINVANCLYTFTKNDAGNWVINRGDVYLNTNGSTGYPHGTTACTFNIAAGNEEGTFYIHSTADSNANGKTYYLYFDRSAKNWNRVDNLNDNATWMANCSMSLFRVAQGEGSGEIYGYEKVTSVDAITEGQYLIGAMASDNNWYIAYPSTVTTTRFNQIAKITGETESTNEGTEVKVAKGQLLSDSSKVDISKCLFTFTDHETEGYYVIESASVAGKYLNNIMADSSTAVPFSATAGKIAIALGHTDMFQFTFNPVSGSTYGDGSGSAHLHFHTELDTPKWNRCGNDASTKCYEYLYRAAKAGEESSTEIPGYVRVTSMDEITSGAQFLIAHTNDTNYYVLYPGTSQNECVAQVVTETATVFEDTTAVTITGNAPGKTTAVVGDTTYNITVTDPDAVYVELEVGQTVTKTIDGVALNGSNTDTTVATVTWTGTEASGLTAVTTVTSGNAYYISDGNGNFLTLSNGALTNSTDIANATQWTMNYVDTPSWGNGEDRYTVSSDGYYIQLSGTTLTVTTGSSNINHYFKADVGFYGSGDGSNAWIYNNGWTVGTAGDTSAKLYTADTTNVSASTTVTITGNAVGKTTVKIGDYNYYITVTAPNVVDVDLEVGESLTYTDTTGNYVNAEGNVQPDTTYASMTVAAGKALKEVTTLESGKQYLIVNKDNGTVLTDTAMTVTGDYGNKPGLATTGSASADSKELWTITSVDGDYTVVQNGKYLAVAGFEAHMYETSVPLTLSYTDNGWLIYDYTTGPALGHEAAGYYLTDNAGNNYVNGALGTSDTSNTYRYWDIYEIVETQTEITFTGNDVGETYAVVGSTQYNITVVEYILDDEINDSSNGYTVNAELQRTRYNELIKNVAKDLYTDESWPQYEEARKAAYALLNTVDGNTYATKAEAQAAINKLIAAIDALEAAKAQLVAAETITIHYQFEGNTVLTEEYKVAADATTLTLPDVIVVDKQTYTISEDQSSDDEDEDIVITDGVLTLPENDTVVYVAVEKGVVLGNGLVASGDINADGDYVGTGDQVADLVKDDGTAMKIAEMTLTTGVTYDLDLADTLASGQTLTWSSSNEDVATVDEDGLVTPKAAGTTTITATIKDADGNIVSVNSIPVTVFERATTNRLSAVYIENIDNTTVYCVVNADTDAKAFEVIEGELIYGYFDTTADDGTATTAFSFFGDPDEAHALVEMTSTNSFGDYYLLHDEQGNLGVGTEYYVLPDNTTGAGYWQAIGLTDNNHDGVADWTKIKAMVEWAIKKGCDGGMGFTRRQSEGNIGSNLTFISDPMPTIEKEVDGVLPTSRLRADYRRYTDGMVAAVHELVYFKLTVTLEAPTVWKPVTNDVGVVQKDDDGNAIIATDEDGNPLGAITYTDAQVEDTILKGAYLYTKDLDQADGVYDGEVDEAYRVQTKDITDQLNAGWTTDELNAGMRELTFYLLYEIQESDIPKFYIDNIAYLNYNYQSHYSKGAQAGAADAEARISVVGTAIDNVVIDFGQSFVYEGHEYTSITDGQTYTFNLTNTHLKGAYVDGVNDIEGITASKATAKYGDVHVTRTDTGKMDDKGYPEYTYTVTYTPNQILLGVDTVLIYGYGENNQEKIINGFLVYPATTVYYEEGFILNDNSTWSSTGSAKATVDQAFELLGASQINEHGELTHKVSNKKHAYGYDPIYNGDGTNDVAKSSISSNTIGESTTFTFTGDGFEIFADSTASTGCVSVQVKNSAGKFVKIFTVDTDATEGYTGVTAGQTVNLDSLPIVSWHSDTHDTYTVTVRKIADTDPVVIDGVRVFNTLNEDDYNNEDGSANSPFEIDLEDDPDFYQLRDYVLYALSIDDKTSVDYKTMCDQVYELMGDAQSAVILDAENPYADITNSTVYTTTTTKTTVTTIVYNDGTSAVVTRVDTLLKEYSDAAKTQLILVRNYTEDTTVYKKANGDEITLAEFGDVTQKTVTSEASAEPMEMTVEGQKTVLTAQDLLDNGPKNEVYLHKGETLVFNVKTDRKIQVGLKAPAASTTYSISYAVEGVEGSTEVAANESLNTSVDMFYELNNDIGTEQTYTITITNTGNNILSVTDLKICDDPNAAFVALTEENIKTALTVMGYSDSCEDSHSFENGFCAVCGIGTARNFTTGNEYGTVGEALAAAKEGETVILLTDCTESTVMVIPGVTLDLNGFKLTASYAVAMRSAHIIDSVGTGCLVTGIKSLVADEDNAMIPVYNGAGYVFTKAGFAIRQDSAYTGDGIKINALAYPVNMDVVELLKDGAADNNIEIVIRLTWDTADGTGSQDFKFTDEVVASVYSSNNGTWASYSKMFSMVVTGFENIENLKANIIVVSGTDAEYVSSSSVDIT